MGYRCGFTAPISEENLCPASRPRRKGDDLENAYREMIEEDIDLVAWAQKLEGYSCADIANLCRDAAQAVFEKKMDSLDPDEWITMPREQARVIITDADFERAAALRKSSVDPATLKKYEEWKATKGAE